MLPQTKLTELSLLWKLTRELMRTLQNGLLSMRPQTKLTELLLRRLRRVLKKLLLLMRPLMERLRRLLSRGEETANRCKRSLMLGRNCRPE